MIEKPHRIRKSSKFLRELCVIREKGMVRIRAGDSGRIIQLRVRLVIHGDLVDARIHCRLRRENEKSVVRQRIVRIHIPAAILLIHVCRRCKVRMRNCHRGARRPEYPDCKDGKNNNLNNQTREKDLLFHFSYIPELPDKPVKNVRQKRSRLTWQRSVVRHKWK